MKGWRQEGTWGVDGPGRWKVARAHSINCRVNQWEVAPVCGVWTEGSCAGGRGEGAFDRNWPQSWNSMPSSSKGPVDDENHKSVGWFSPPFSTASTLINLWVVDTRHLRMGCWRDHPGSPMRSFVDSGNFSAQTGKFWHTEGWQSWQGGGKRARELRC